MNTAEIDDLVLYLDTLPTLQEPNLSQVQIDLIIDALTFYKEMNIL